jgi:hypothetical protein
MNIFVVSTDPILAGSILPDKLVVKMILETAQMMSTTCHTLGVVDDRLYKSSHLNHPCSIWARQNRSNFIWLWNHGKAIAAEYTRRYGKVHKSEAVLDVCIKYLDLLPSGDRTPFAQCMPDEFKHNDVTIAYRRYLRSKSYFDGGFRKSRDFTKLYSV